MRTPLVGGNWKCNGTQESLKKLCKAWADNKDIKTEKIEVVICVPAIHLGLAKEHMRKDFQISAQNVYLKSGAFTGEQSVEMVKDFGVAWTLLGHSERRHVFHEANDFIGKKIRPCYDQGLKVIACVGETLEERKANKTEEVICDQLKAYADNMKPEEWDDRFVIAYEPVWAIGTGLTATPQQAQEAHECLREWMQENISSEAAEKIRILYGGSVTPQNAGELFLQKDVDGFLVGGASLKPDFSVIINAANQDK